uniref:Polybromo 1, like n=1 Tax=Astyanax mexicanus TaxID=7994 RepID=A0A8B9K311_ASTMX
MDLRTIEHNIRIDRYNNEEAFIKDVKLMFRNARHYNEEGSQVYNDSGILEKIVKDKLKELGPAPEDDDVGSPKAKLRRSGGTASPKKARSQTTPLQQKLSDLFEAIRNFTDNRGRRLSTVFLRLPSRSELPDYYAAIKRPIDMERIRSHMVQGRYQDVESMAEDFILMFNNACTYNEPESLIYRDALLLHRAFLEARRRLEEDDEASAAVSVAPLIRELIRSLFVSVMSHQDDEGRCYSDSLAEVPAVDPANPEDPPLNLEVIRNNVENGRYRRLDVFQEHFFEMLEKARRLNRTDSEIFEDSVELQQFFVKIRDELCKNGEILLSPALSYTFKHLHADIDQEKREKLPQEIEEDQLKGEEEKKVMPMFVAPPPKPQRLLHSEAYLKYIEGLSADSPTISKWDQSLKAQRTDGRLSREQESRLPSHWLKSKGAHTTMADALWRLRDLMMRDTLNIRQAYNL